MDLSAGYTRYSDSPDFSIAFPGGGTQTVFLNIPETKVLRAESSVPLYTGGRLTGQREAAEHRRDAATGEVATGTLDIVYEASEAYWDLATAREKVRVLTLSLAAFEQHLLDAGHRETLGLAPRSEALTVQLERDQAELARVLAEKDGGVVVFPADTAQEVHGMHADVTGRSSLGGNRHESGCTRKGDGQGDGAYAKETQILHDQLAPK